MGEPAPQVEIELGVPIPDTHKGEGIGLSKILRELMKAPVGASVHIPNSTTSAINSRCWLVSQQGGWYTIRKLSVLDGGGHRVWKIKELTVEHD